MKAVRHNEPLQLNALLEQSLNTQKENKLTCDLPKYSKPQLWELFKFYFKNITGKDFLETDKSKSYVSLIFYYFLKSKKFFEHENLRPNLSEPSFNKGLLIIGGYGVGKIIAVSYKDVNNPKIAITMRQEGLGKKEWIVEDLSGVKKAKKK
jgi:DNA replication protein DnaC